MSVILDEDAVPTFLADLGLLVQEYQGDGNDLSVLTWSGNAWIPLAFTFDSATNMVVIEDMSSGSCPVVICQTPEPATVVLLAVGGICTLIRRKRRIGE